MAAAHGVTVLHNSRDTIHIVLEVDDTCSSMTARGQDREVSGQRKLACWL